MNLSDICRRVYLKCPITLKSYNFDDQFSASISNPQGFIFIFVFFKIEQVNTFILVHLIYNINMNARSIVIPHVGGKEKLVYKLNWQTSTVFVILHFMEVHIQTHIVIRIQTDKYEISHNISWKNGKFWGWRYRYSPCTFKHQDHFLHQRARSRIILDAPQPNFDHSF